MHIDSFRYDAECRNEGERDFQRTKMLQNIKYVAEALQNPGISPVFVTIYIKLASKYDVFLN